MQNNFERTRPMQGMYHNLLRDYPKAEPVMAPSEIMTDETQKVMEKSEFPKMTPLGMAYIPFQQWEQPYDTDTAFPIGTIFPSLDYPFQGGGPCA